MTMTFMAPIPCGITSAPEYPGCGCGLDFYVLVMISMLTIYSIGKFLFA
jgi:hypothetical protein